MSPSSSDVRYRCEACGNLTRFEVTATRTTRAFHHYTIGGELTIEDPQIVAESVESIVCRWCGTGDNVVEIDASDEAVLAAGETDGGSSDDRVRSSGGVG